jgi:hypothetical protein
MAACARCGAESDVYADGLAFCGLMCLELGRRGIAYVPGAARLRPAGDDLEDTADDLLDARLDAELDRVEQQAQARATARLKRLERARYRLPAANRYGAVRPEGSPDG